MDGPCDDMEWLGLQREWAICGEEYGANVKLIMEERDVFKINSDDDDTLVGMNPMLAVTVPVKVWASVHNCCLGHYKGFERGAKA